ncbi:anhydro-N-acetylmuramic acid kinase [Altibacter sp. HG106]|uniref:anhydro-N-acetylmuramic acid kinase n=1 Tax=Altibacter sp. HG106 TaxID=3023937 RepID=UPI002350F73F|nr:anhydro-N-acetylmuramic acid kinase [Altibacter sp. HG106]MDC7995925.1 anhydro-N-acetylmuramic acid kinase [Altibacter sp. HG106]
MNRAIFTEMKQNQYRVLGVMSGTSLDGIDLAVVSLQAPTEGRDNHWSFSLEETQTIPYDPTWKHILREAVHFSEGRLQQLNHKYTHYLASVIKEHFGQTTLQGFDAVCSHGHTILHEPDKGYTLQIGNQQALASLLQTTVVCDFRVADVDLGGQGAPLVPVGDRLLFSEYNYCLNLGGFANCSFEYQGKRIAYDICPVNIVLNRYAEKLGFEYDASGALAASGTINEELLEQLNSLSFYKQKPPKSLGIEWVLQEMFPLLNASEEPPKNILRTVTEHIAVQLSRQFNPQATVLVTGGGAYNDYLLNRLRIHSRATYILPEKQLIDFKEALVFALLGVLRLRGEANCLSSVTGASKDHSSGVIYKP